jgi:O-antigen ligase
MDDSSMQGWRQRFAGVLLVVGCLSLWTALPVSLPLMHISFVVMFLGIVLGAYPIHRLPGFYWGCGFAGWQVLGIVVGMTTDLRPPGHGHGTTFIWLVMYPVVLVMSQERWRHWALSLLLVTVVASFVVALVQFFIGHGGKRPFRISAEVGLKRVRSSGFMALHLTQGFIMTLVGLIFWTRSTTDGLPPLMRWTARLIAPLAVFLANSRTGLLALLGGFAGWFLAAIGRWRWMGLVVLVPGFFLVLTWFWFIHPDAIRNVIRLDDGRLIHWRVAIHVIGESPWFGVGEGRFEDANNRWVKKLYPDHSQDHWLDAPDAHNSLLGLSTEHGVPATILFIAFLTAILRHLYRQREHHRDAWRLGCGVVAAMAVGSQFEHYAGHSVPSYVFYCSLGLALALGSPFEKQVAAGLVKKSAPNI